MSGTTATVVAHVPGAIYKGLALLHLAIGNYLLATDFHHARVDVFDQSFQQISLASLLFRDPTLPAGYAPFNVCTVGDQVYRHLRQTGRRQGRTRWTAPVSASSTATFPARRGAGWRATAP